jgi:hypothetical protein
VPFAFNNEAQGCSSWLSVQEALDELEGLYRVYLKDPKKRFRINRLVAMTKKQEKILRAIDKRLLQDS